MLLAVFAFNNMGHYLIFKVLQMQVSAKMEQQIRNDLPDSKLHIIKISKNDKVQPQWSWFEGDEEFSYQGTMYDVVRAKTGTDSVCYYGITDTGESVLADTLDNMVQDNMAHPKKANHLGKSDNKLFFINSHASFTSEKTVFEKDTIFYRVKEAFQSAALDIPIPPPQLV